ncbi:ATP-binding cassette sub-family A member 12 isoform X1 [Pseudonaja textilis]|uniref:ATP-binding cassette sub-family A member 12 isoform X1 n=1 Tax=Pseudonaja textilis TaxID=8673 RepID=UPI000EAA951D|nr:ATP-binding cassette sub-family A member 12 isoform X1 [Pseudonaja textilis]
MASLFQHLWVLLWKNWLSVKRQPLWSFTLISLPVFSFILMAVIRIQFPPEAQSNCYLAPRNLPSTGFLPFLQTVLCSSDATCKSVPYTPEDLLPKLNISLKSRRQRSSASQAEERSPSSQSADVLQNRNHPLGILDSTFNLKVFIENISSPTSYDKIYLLNDILTLAEKQNSSQSNLKVAVCEVLSVNASLQSLLLETLGTNIYQPLCLNNMSLLESFFQELRTHISKLQKDPSYQMGFVQEAGSFLSLISQVQNETSIWNLLLMTPDIIHGATAVRDMADTLHSRKRLFMKRDKSHQMILNMTSWLSTLNCSEQDKNNLAVNYICEQPDFSKKILILFDRMKVVLRNLLGLDFADEELKTGHFLKDFKRNTKSQNSLKKMPLFDLKETQNIHNLNRNIRDITFLNNIIFKARKAWQTVKMGTVLKFFFLPEKYRKYLTSVEEVPSLVNFLLKPATTDNFPEKLLELQKIFSVITNSRTNHNYLLISSLTNLMQKIQNSINESQWNEFNIYWHIVEKLRSAKWSDTDILIYRQILDTLHDNLYVNHDNFGLPLKKELEQMIKFVNHLLKKYDAGSIKGTNVSMVLNTILKSLQVLEDLEKKYISEFFIVNPLMNTNNETVQKLFQLIMKGIEILSDPSQIEAFNINKTDSLLRFSQALSLLDLYMTPVWHNSSIQAKMLQLLYLAPSLLQMENIQADNSLSDCTVKDFHLITIEVFFNNATLKEALSKRKCNFRFSSLDFENQTTYHYMFTQLFQLTTKSLKPASLFEIIQGNKRKHFAGEFQCLIRLSEVSSSFLSKLIGLHKYQNSWIEKIDKNLNAFPLDLSQHNLTCREPLLSNIIDKISALYIQSPFIFKETVADIKNILDSPSFWNQTFVPFFLLHNKHQKIVAKILQMSKSVHQSKWSNFSEILSETVEILHSKQNVTNTKQYIQLLEMSRKAVILVGIGLANKEKETYKLLETLSWGMKVSSLEEVLDMFRLFLNSSSGIDYKTYFRKNMNTFLSPNDALFQRLFYNNPPEQIKHILNKTTRMLNELFLNWINLKFTMIWKTIHKIISIATTQFPVEIPWAFNSKEEIPLTSSDFFLKSSVIKDILKPFLTPQNNYHSKTNVNLITYLSQLVQRIQNTAKKSWSNELKAFVNIHRELRPVMYSSLFLSTLYKHFSLLNNASDLHFNSELQGLAQLLPYVLPKYNEENPHINTSEQINIAVRKLLFQQRFVHQFIISQLETILPLANNSHKIFENIYDILNQGAMILSDSKLEETEKGKIATLYGFSQFLFQKEFSESFLGDRNETKTVDILYLILSPLLHSWTNKMGEPHNCNAQDIIHIIFQMLFRNTTLSEVHNPNHCELLFSSMDFEKRTNQTFIDFFLFSIKNFQQTKLTNLYQKNNVHFSNDLLCIIKSLQFSSGLLLKMNILFDFQHPWIQEMYATLAKISKQLPLINSTCFIPVLDGINDVTYNPSKIPLLFSGYETQYYIQNFIDKLIDWNELAILFKQLQDCTYLNIPLNEATQKNEDEISIPSKSNFSQIWAMLSKWYHTETENARYGFEMMEKVLDNNKSVPEIFNVSISILNHLDLLKEFKANPDPNFLSKRTKLQYKFDRIRHPFLMIAETVLNKTFWKEWEQAQSPSNLIARFLFSEFENVFLKTSHNSNFSSYFICIMNVFQGPDDELSGNGTLPPKIRELKEVLFNSRSPFATVPEILMLKLAHLQNLTSLLCDFESIRWLQQTCQLADVSFAELCSQSEFHKKLLHSRNQSDSALSNLISHRRLFQEFQEIIVGNPQKLQQHIKWLQENVPQLKYFRDNLKYISSLTSVMNITKFTPHSRKQDMVIDLFRNTDGLKNDLKNIVGLSTKSISAFTEMPLSENKTKLIFQILKLESCNTDIGDAKLEIIAKQFCNFSITERAYKSYLLGITFLRYLDVYKFIYKMLFPKEFQIPVDKALEVLRDLDHLRRQLVSDVHPLLDAIHSLKKLRMARHAPLSKALFEAGNLTINNRVLETLSKTFCNHDITPLFFESLLPDFEEQNVHHSSTDEDEQVHHIMKKYSIPSDTTPFCISLFLDLVKTPSGALIWSFLKPMVRGRILYSPDTPETRAIMEKSNSTLKLMADLTQKAQEWLDRSPLLMDSLTILNDTLPMLKNTLQNPFVQVFIKLMVKLDAVELLNQINELDDIRLELQNSTDIINQLIILARLSVNISSCVLLDRIQPGKTVEEMEMMAKDLFLRNELFASVIFKLPSNETRKHVTPSGLSLPPLVNYTIRMSSKISQTTKRIREKVWTGGPHNSASQSQIYSRAFVYIQDSIDRAIIELQTGKSAEDIAVQVQATPYPCYNKDMFLTSVTYSLPFTLMAAWILFIASFVKKLVQEKDLRLYEYMKMMGVNSSSHFFAWFIECIIFLLLTNIFLIFILKFGNILPKINVTILFLYVLDYSFSIIAMCYLISVFFNNTNIAALVGCLVYILAFFPFIVLLVVENQMSLTIKSLLSLLSPTAFSYGSQYIARYEEQGIGLQWDNINVSPISGDNTNFSWMCWLILIDSFIYFILGWYIRNVFPGKYGMAAPWYFPFLPSYWTERYGYFPLLSEKLTGYLFTNFFLRKQPAFPEKMYVHSASPSNIEPEPTHLEVGVSLQGITKIYESKAAVQNLNLNFYEGNITSLLGHNGAGKTTTISILTGLFPASSGTIFVYGKDIRTDQDFIRKNMGICMQHNVLFDYLTTKEHLLLYGYIKVPQWSKEELQEEIDRILKETGLYNHRHKLTGSLSGGMKRKLSISIALLGGSKVVILDEPTTGVDPCSRRGIWEIISKNRKGRTIILSTHHLDEAEVLSDRIAFLEHGGLKCCGSPFYLKETYGSGYHLTLTKEKSSVLNVGECNTSTVTATIQAHLPEAYLKEDIGGELIYVLPPFNNKVSLSYQSLLRNLDSNLSDLHIGCYGISDSTVEEVFLNLTKDFANDEQTEAELSQEGPSFNVDNDGLSMNSNNVFEPDDEVLIKSGKPNNLSLLLRKATALFIKRFHHTRRDVKGFIAQVILPVLFVTAAMGLGTLRTKVAEYPALHLSPALYGSSGQSDFFGNFNQTTDILVASLFSFPGIDNICLNRSNLTCFKEDVAEKWIFSGNKSDQYTACNCTLSGETCPKLNFSPPHKRTFSSRTIYNLTGHDVETYLLVTARDFVQKRYGGWSFGLPLPSNLRFDINPVPANRTVTKVWYNPEGYHSLPVYLNSLNNFILHAYLPHGNTSGYGISVVAHPYPGGESQEQAMLSSLLDIIVSMSVLIGYSITTASFVLYVVKEHQTKAKQLQHISGLGVTSYWVTNFIYDMVYFLVPVILSVGVISAFQIPAFFNDNNLLAVFLLLFLFGYSTFSWMYLLAGIFKETGMAFIVYVCINLFFGVNTIISHSVVFLLSQEKATDKALHDLAETLRHIFLIFPQFCFGYGLIELSQYHALMGFLKAYGVVYPDKTFELDRTTSKLLGMFIQGTLFFTVRLLLDDGTIQKIWHKILQFLFNKLHGKSPLYLEDIVGEEDKDVRAERERVTLGLSDCDVLQLQNLSKIYHLPYRRIVAVRNVNIGIPAGECFGLLGVNGAGKTTIFKMLTGDIGPTDGRLLMQDETGSLNEIDDTRRSQFGYCPQEDALDDLLTVEEHMYYYARLHGIPEEDIKGIVFHLLYRLNLMPYRCRIASMCSYGTNRKLSTALALLGKPSVLLLDEPSSGMDPNAKRHLWKIITEEVQNQCSVILTSHSMEECEALCTRLAIMVNGHFQCLGSLQHIKSRFGKGFTVKMHLNNSADNIEKLTLFLQTNFPNTYLRDHQLNMVEYHIPVSAGGVANIFQLLEMNKAVFEIKHFSVSQTTLEEVFINFAKAQASPDISDAITCTSPEA